MIDWDQWRADYDSTLYEAQQEFYSVVWAKYPGQKRFNSTAVQRFFSDLTARRVIEVGGWTGEMAALCLGRDPDIQFWRNYEICREAVEHSVVADPRYEAVSPNWVWDLPTSTFAGFDVLVLSHVAEHMRGRNLRSLVSVATPSVQHVYVESPIGPEGRDWIGYHGTHILECGWNDIDIIFAEAGFGVEPVTKQIRFYHRG